MREHRVGVVRTEARASQLLYAFARGVPYKAIESKCGDKWARQEALRKAGAMAKRFGIDSEYEKLVDWMMEEQVA